MARVSVDGEVYVGEEESRVWEGGVVMERECVSVCAGGRGVWRLCERCGWWTCVVCPLIFLHPLPLAHNALRTLSPARTSGGKRKWRNKDAASGKPIPDLQYV